jgi:hypothetical protein
MTVFIAGFKMLKKQYVKKKTQPLHPPKKHNNTNKQNNNDISHLTPHLATTRTLNQSDTIQTG